MRKFVGSLDFLFEPDMFTELELPGFPDPVEFCSQLPDFPSMPSMPAMPAMPSMMPTFPNMPAMMPTFPDITFPQLPDFPEFPEMMNGDMTRMGDMMGDMMKDLQLPEMPKILLTSFNSLPSAESFQKMMEHTGSMPDEEMRQAFLIFNIIVMLFAIVVQHENWQPLGLEVVEFMSESDSEPVSVVEPLDLHMSQLIPAPLAPLSPTAVTQAIVPPAA